MKRQTVKQRTVKLPAFLASALINGDLSGLEDRYMPVYEAALKLAEGGYYVDVGEASFSCGAYALPASAGGNLGGDYADYTINYYSEVD